MTVRKVASATVVRELGRGAMGVVYEAFQEDLERRVAIKELPAPGSRNKELAERFRREGVAYAKLRHQNILAVYDFVEKNDALYLVMELVDGADLSVVAKTGALAPALVALIGARVADALAHAHHHKILHRDIKPANVIVSRTGEVKLMDFGVSKDLEASDLTREGMVVGSLPYMAPEILASADYDPRADIWALGVMLYELATGVRPFKGKDDSSLMRAIMRGNHAHVRTYAPTMPRRLGRAIERCLARKRDKRWPAALVLARELDACAASLLGDVDPEDTLATMMRQRELAVPESSPGTQLDPAVMHETRMSTPTRGEGTRRVAMALLLLLSFIAGGWFFLS
jgi:serine/threonine protein kinase